MDLSTLRSDEAPSGPLKTSRPGTPKAGTFPPAYAPQLSVPAVITAEVDGTTTAGTLKPPPSPVSGLSAQQLRNRRFSDLVNTPAQALGAASDAVRNTADHGLKTISTSLGDSYKFVLGKLREGQTGPAGAAGEVVVPKTLEDARKLIGTPPLDDDVSITSDTAEETDLNRRPPLRDDKMLNLIGGRKFSRDHSVDSSRSAGSSIRRDDATKENISGANPTSAPNLAAANRVENPATPLEAMRNFGNSLNPMAKIAGGIGSFRPFGRTSSIPITPLAGKQPPVAEGGDLATVRRSTTTTGSRGTAKVDDIPEQAFPDIAANLPPRVETPKINPPIRRFMDMQNPADLRIGEVLELLRDYRRLATALKDAGAFNE